jgi:transposase
MNLDLASLPDNQSISKQQALLLLHQQEENFQTQQEKYQAQIDYLEEQLRLLRNELFGRKSEKPPREDHDQIPLFGKQAEVLDDVPEPEEEGVVIPSHSRRKRGRKPLPDHLPRVDVIHDLSDDEKMCACGHVMSCIGQEQCEKLDYIPANIQVLRHIRYKYACKNCEGVESDGPTVRIAPPPAQLIPKSNATEGLLAHIFTSKFADGLPLYRQQKIFVRLGLDLPRSTMANWAIEASIRCKPLIELLQYEIRGGPLINVDETTLQVFKEPGRRNTSKSYMWLYRGGAPDKPALVYQYAPSRSGQVAEDFIGDYKGYLQSDAFVGYDRFEGKPQIRLLGCWAHARRKFFAVVKIKKKIRSNRKSPKSLADEALAFIGRLYRIEKQACEQELSRDQIVNLRQSDSVPVLKRFKQWLDEKSPIAPPKSLLGKAIAYTLDNWSRLIVYVEDGLLKPDNNAAENALRPFVVGRKNWLFAGHPRGADASAIFFSLIETAKANRLEPYAYLKYVFEQLPVTDEKNYSRLLPGNIDREAADIPSI